jgi:hypothetical protein
METRELEGEKPVYWTNQRTSAIWRYVVEVPVNDGEHRGAGNGGGE